MVDGCWAGMVAKQRFAVFSSSVLSDCIHTDGNFFEDSEMSGSFPGSRL